MVRSNQDIHPRGLHRRHLAGCHRYPHHPYITNCCLRRSHLLDCARRYSTAIRSPAISIHYVKNYCTCLPCQRIGLIIINSRLFLPVGFPGGINSGRRGFPKTLWLSAFTLDITRMPYIFVLDVSVILSACADRFKFHLDTPSSMYT